MEIFEYKGEGYRTMIKFGGWRTAFLRYARRFDSITYLERHLLTDEVFVLLEGEATLLIGESAEPTVMEKGKMYNIAAGEWHNVRVSRDVLIMIVENAETGPENTEYLQI